MVDLVREELMPHFEKLPGCLRLGLLRIDGTRSYLALQHWEDRDTWHATINSDYYQSWYQAYEPTLERWDRIMLFQYEWNSEDILHTGSSV